MSDDLELDLRHKDDFDQVYDLDDPRPYYRGLRQAAYRMPGVVADFLRGARPAIAKARGKPGALRLLDFASGYGAIGALLRHDLGMAGLYAHYAGRWHPSDGRANWSNDRAAFEPQRRPAAGFEIGGLDIAASALEYAQTLGFVDHRFAEDVAEGAPSAALRAYLSDVDVVTESGSAGALLPDAVRRLLDAATRTHLPWFLYCPRPDVDWTRLDTIWVDAGYRAERCNRAPVRYRKPLGDYEHAEVLRLAAQFGRRPEDTLRDGYILVDLMLARPAADRLNPPIDYLSRSDL